jgi:hypothetical protein|eukprot:COSAG06_NODE_22914_length_709_cov_0.760656_1_plen_86_part_00
MRVPLSDQGESDVGSPYSPKYPPHPGKSWFGAPYYGCALSAMVNDWRVKFKKPELPFLLVELAAYLLRSILVVQYSAETSAIGVS